MRGLLARYRPDLDESSAAPIVRLAGGSIGRALELAAAGGVDLYRNLLELLSRRQGIDPAAAQALADRLARPEADDAYRVFEELLRQLLARLAVAAAKNQIGAQADESEAEIVAHLGRRAAPTVWAELHEEIGRTFARTDGLNLDRKQTVLGAFFAIDARGGVERAARL